MRKINLGKIVQSAADSMLTIRFPHLFIIITSVIVLAILAGIITGINEIYGFVLFSIMFSLFIVIAVLIAPSFGIIIILTTVIFIDVARRVIAFYTGNWSTIQLLIVDVVIALTLIAILLPGFIKRGKIISRSLPFGFILLSGMYVLWIFIAILNPTVPDFVLSLVAIRVYLSPIFVIVMAWYVTDTWSSQDWNLAYKIMLFYAVIVIVFGVITFLVNPNSVSGVLRAVLQPAEHVLRTWEDGSINLSSSVFASSKRFGRFLLMTFPFLWIYLDLNGKHRTKLLIFLLYGIGCFVSGSREALLLLIFMFFFLGNWWATIGQFFPVVIIGSAAIILLAGPEEAQRRLEFTISTPSDWISRVEYMTIAPVLSRIPTELDLQYTFGIGAGRSGQSSVLYETDFNTALKLPDNPFYDRTLLDAGLYHVFIELGLIGLVLFLVFHIYILILPWRYDINDPYIRVSAIALLVWFILFLKSHTVLTDQVTMIGFWFYVGLITTRISQSRRSVLDSTRNTTPKIR